MTNTNKPNCSQIQNHKIQNRPLNTSTQKHQEAGPDHEHACRNALTAFMLKDSYEKQERDPSQGNTGPSGPVGHRL